jgi:hypothetical protein
MSATNLEIVFEGSSATNGMIDARILADSLMGCNVVFQRTNEILNGEASHATVLVRSEFKSGSFIVDLQFAQDIFENARQLITAHPFADASGLTAVIGFLWKNKETVKDSLIDLYKWLKGKKPDKAIQIGNNTELSIGNNKKIVSTNVYNLYGDSAIRAGLSLLTQPLRETGIDRITIKHDGTEQISLEKDEAGFFEPTSLELAADEMSPEGQRRAVLVVSKLSFAEGSTWSFIERGATLVAKIEDKRFWEQIHQHTITFGEGDRLRVDLKWAITKKRNKLTAKNTIVKVIEVLDRPKQLEIE